MSLIVVLPAYNEAQNLPPLLAAFAELHRTLPLSCIVVDDGSADGTAAAVEGCASLLPVAVVRHERNRGLSAALETGFRAACQGRNDDDVVVCMDADNTHVPGQIPMMVARLGEGFDIVIASRYRRGAKVEGVSLFRRALSGGATLLFTFLVPTPGVRDYSCGFRAYRVGILRRALERYGEEVFSLKGFACTAGLLFACRRLGARMSEIPIDLKYQQKRGVSKLALRRTVGESLRLVWHEMCYHPDGGLSPDSKPGDRSE